MEIVQEYVGQFHPIFLHLPIGLYLGIFALEVILLFKEDEDWDDAIAWLHFIGLLSCAAAVASGIWLHETGGYGDREILLQHKNGGLIVGGLAIAAFLFQRISSYTQGRFSKFIYRALILSLTIAITITGHLGGTFTHGEIELLPVFETESDVETLPEQAVADALEEVVSAPEDLTVYAEVISPLFKAYCNDCHGVKKSKGKLRMHTPEAILAGGKHDFFINKENPGQSLLITNIMLPEDDEDVMPPEDEFNPLNDDQKAVINWWVENGARFDQAMDDENIPADIHEKFKAIAPLSVSTEKPEET